MNRLGLTRLNMIGHLQELEETKKFETLDQKYTLLPLYCCRCFTRHLVAAVKLDPYEYTNSFSNLIAINELTCLRNHRRRLKFRRSRQVSIVLVLDI